MLRYSSYNRSYIDVLTVCCNLPHSISQKWDNRLVVEDGVGWQLGIVAAC